MVAICLANVFSQVMYAALYLYTPEVFPTTVRATGVSLLSAISRCSGMARETETEPTGILPLRCAAQSIRTLASVHQALQAHRESLFWDVSSYLALCLSVQLSNLCICQTCTSVKLVHLSNLSICQTCASVECVQLSNSCICQSCASVKRVHLSNLFIC